VRIHGAARRDHRSARAARERRAASA
jgi:hypothetical protein